MNAIVMSEDGTLTHTQVPDPKPGLGEAVVELKKAGINRRDIVIRSGLYKFPRPFIPGSDGVGVRRDTGEEVIILPSLQWGDREEAPGDDFRILGGPDNGTYAELVKLPVVNLYPKPHQFSLEQAAAFPLAALTAYRALFTRARVSAGETVLVLGAGSGVSTFAVMLARQAGARVLVTSSCRQKLDRVRELGAEAGVNYTDGDWVAEVRALSGGRGVDVVFDSVGSTWPDSLRCLRRGGRAVVFGATGGAKVEIDVRQFYFGQFSLLGTTMGSPRDFASLLQAVADCKWFPIIDSVWPLAEVEAAHNRMKSNHHFGKLVLSID